MSQVNQQKAQAAFKEFTETQFGFHLLAVQQIEQQMASLSQAIAQEPETKSLEGAGPIVTAIAIINRLRQENAELRKTAAP